MPQTVPQPGQVTTTASKPDPATELDQAAITKPALDDALTVVPSIVPEITPPPMAPPSAQGQGLVRGNQGKAILLMCLVSFTFGMQDGFSRYLGGKYSPMFIIMLRFWFMAVFVTLLAMRAPGGLHEAVKSKRPVLQVIRGVLLVLEILVTIIAFVRLGLIDTHAIFACTPLLVVALSGPVLGEKIGWRRWIAVGVGFSGILIVLKPTSGVLSWDSALPFLGAVMFALYSLLTRMVGRDDSATVSFFWTSTVGAVTATAIGIFWWQPVELPDVPLLLILCAGAALSHFLLIRAYEMAEASSLQPFAYTQLVWVSIIGVLLFNETLAPNVAIGGAIVVGAGLFTWWRSRQKAREQA